MQVQFSGQWFIDRDYIKLTGRRVGIPQANANYQEITDAFTRQEVLIQEPVLAKSVQLKYDHLTREEAIEIDDPGAPSLSLANWGEEARDCIIISMRDRAGALYTEIITKGEGQAKKWFRKAVPSEDLYMFVSRAIQTAHGMARDIIPA